MRTTVIARLISTALLFASCQPALASYVDSDGDGLSDTLEAVLMTSTDAYNHADPQVEDTNQNGMPDGFELALTGMASYPGPMPTVVPAVRVLTHRPPNQSPIVCDVLVIGDPNQFDAWGVLYAAALDVEPENVTSAFALVATDVWSGYELRVYRDTIRAADVANAPVKPVIAAGIDVNGWQVSDQVGVFIEGGWSHETRIVNWPVPEIPDPTAPTGQQVSHPTEEAAESDPAASTEEVCGAAERREPTGTPGLLKSVVLSAGCQSGAWACVASVCTVSGSVAKPMTVIDTFSLIGPGN